MKSLKELLEEELTVVGTTSERTVTEIPYPQANSLDVVLSVVDTLRDSGMSLYDLVSSGIVKSARQASYYYNAAAFLGFCFKRGNYYYPTELVSELRKVRVKDKAARFAGMILSNHHIAKLYIGVFQFTDNDARSHWLEGQIDPQIKSEVTRKRRASSMSSWLAWIQKHLPTLKD